jgi:hypothetical protein
MLSKFDSIYGKKLINPFVAAVPNSLILKEAFNLLLDFITYEKLPYNEDFRFIQTNQDTKVNYLTNSF